MKMECGLMVDYINGSLPFGSKWEERIEKHLAVCLECQELVELMGVLPVSMNESTFFNGMKARILAMVFKEVADSGFSSSGCNI